MSVSPVFRIQNRVVVVEGERDAFGEAGPLQGLEEIADERVPRGEVIGDQHIRPSEAMAMVP
jgi:hypothetical protein